MSNENQTSEDFKDRLVDGALREVVGEETPPDLSEKILFAATGEQSQQLSTLAPGEENMATLHRQETKNRNRWIGIVIAASLLIGVAMSLPIFQSSRESARLPRAIDKLGGLGEQNQTIDEALVVSAQDKELKGPAQHSKSELQLGVTPRIISPAEEQRKLGVQTSGNQELSAEWVEELEDRRVSESVVPANLPSQQPASSRPLAKNKRQGGTENRSYYGMPANRPALGVVPSTEGDNLYSFRMGFDRQVQPEAESRQVPLGWRKGTTKPESGFVPSDQSLPPAGVALLARRAEVTRQLNEKSHRYVALSSKVNADHDNRDRYDSLDLKNITARQLATLQQDIQGLRRVERLIGQQLQEQGQGSAASGDKYSRIYENPFVKAEGEKAVSTFSIDVDTASYANVRQFLTQSGQLPPPDAVRIEECINYFDYDYTAPTDDTPFAAHVEVAGCPWQAEHRLVRVGIKGRELAINNRPQSNLVFLIDVSGSMDEPTKLPLLVEGMKLLTRELGENDRVAIVVYASSEGLALPSTRGDQQSTILAALEKLRAGGSTAGGAGIELAYKIAQDNFIQGGVNRVILATDGDFNVGTTSTADLERLAESNAKESGVFLTVLGFGRGNLNDAMMEAISGKGNGNYHYVDNRTEAEKVLVAEMAGTLVTIAKDVKIQIEFNPSQVAGYRLIGYENRMLATEDFNDDKKDAGEIGAGHTVTAIYEVVPTGAELDVPAVDPLKYQRTTQTNEPAAAADDSGEMLTIKIRYKQPDGDKSTKLEFPITDNGQSFAEASDDFQFASAVASFGMLLRDSEHQGITSYSAVQEIAQDSLGKDLHGYRAEFLELVRNAKQLSGE